MTDMNNFSFDATQIAPRESFDPVPDGWYAVTIANAEWKATKAGAMALSLTLEIDGNSHPQFANRNLWASLNLNNASDKAREIAQRELSSICHAINKLQLANVTDLLGSQLMAKVKAVPADGTYDARNEVRGYKGIGDAKPLQPLAKPANAVPANKPTATPGWKR